MSVQSGNYYETEQLIVMLEAVINSHKAFRNVKLFHWESVFRIAEYHEVTNMVYFAILGMDIRIPPECRRMFEDSFRQAVGNVDELKNVVEAVIWKFEKEKKHLLLTGSYSYLPYYKKSEMGETKSAEFFVEKGKRGLIQEMMYQLDFLPEYRGTDRTVYSRGMIRLEFIEKWRNISRKTEKYFSRPLSSYPMVEGFRYIHRMNAEDDYLRQICDFAADYAEGFPRLRSFVNFWLFYQSNNQTLDYRTLIKRLKKFRLSRFSGHILCLTAFWFGRIQIPAQEENECLELAHCLFSRGREGRDTVRADLPRGSVKDEKDELREPERKRKKFLGIKKERKL
mgnify:FL=1